MAMASELICDLISDAGCVSLLQESKIKKKATKVIIKTTVLINFRMRYFGNFFCINNGVKVNSLNGITK
jgi:hypothetical protein